MAARPDPSGPMPDGWKHPERWPAFVAMARDGLSYQRTAELVGRKVGTISRWVSEWRTEYGRDVLPPRRPAWTDEARARGSIIGAVRTAESWAAVRAVAARKHGELSAAALDVAAEVLAGYLNDPARLRELTIDDALKLGKLADLLAARADVLADVRAAPGPPLPGDVPGVPPGLLDGLEAPALGEGAEVIEMLELVAGRYRTIANAYDEQAAG